MKLSEFLKEKLSARGAQAKFARATGISDGTVSKWARGEMERAPNFENCIRIAIWAGNTPIEIFEMAERPDFIALFRDLFPDYSREADLAAKKGKGKFTCSHAEHRDEHEMLEKILIADSKAAEWIHGNLIMFNRGLGNSPSGGPPSGKTVADDRFRETDRIFPAPDEAQPEKKRRRNNP